MKKRYSVLALAVGAVSCGFAVQAFGDSGVWQLPTGGSWIDTTTPAWSPATFPNGASQTALINQNFTAAPTITLDQDITVGSLTLGDATGTAANAGFFGVTIGSGTTNTASGLILNNGASAATISRAPVTAFSVTNVVDIISAPVTLTSSVNVSYFNSNATSGAATAAGILRFTGPISGPGGFNLTGSSTAVVGTVQLQNTSSSFTGDTTVVNGYLQVSGDIKPGVNGALGNATTAIRLGTSATSTTNTTSGQITLQVNATGSNGNNEFARGIDMSGANGIAGGRFNLRYQSIDGSSAPHNNTLTVSGPVTISNIRDFGVLPQRVNQTVNFTGLISGIGTISPTGTVGTTNLVINESAFAATGPTENVGPSTVRFANSSNSFSSNIQIVNGTLIVAGNVPASSTTLQTSAMDSPIGRGGSTAGITMNGGNGTNIVTNGALQQGNIRSFFMETPGTTMARQISIGGGSSVTGLAAYGGPVSVVGGYRIGGLNTSGEVIYTLGFFPTPVANGNAGVKTIPLAYNMAFIAQSGGVTTFQQAFAPNNLTSVTGASNTSGQSRLTINGFRNHPALDLNADGVADASANAVFGDISSGTVRLNHSATGTQQSGTIEVLGGTLLVNGRVGSNPGEVTFTTANGASNGDTVFVNSGATLGGYGRVYEGKPGSIIDVSGTLNPGDTAAGSVTTASQFSSDKPITMRGGSKLVVDLNSGTLVTANPSTAASYDRVLLRGASAATGTFTIEPTAQLQVNTGYQPVLGTFYTIVDLNLTAPGSVTGTFQGLPQGAIVGSTFGSPVMPVAYALTYTAGGGADIGLTAVSPVNQWAGPGSGTWTQTGSWTNPAGLAYYPDNTTQTALFGTNVAAPSTVALDSAVTVGSLQFTGTRSYTVSGTGSITVVAPAVANIANAPANRAYIRADTTSHTVNVPLIIAGDTQLDVPNGGILNALGGVSISSGKTLTVNPRGSLNLGVISGAGNLSVTFGLATGTLSATRIALPTSSLSVAAGVTIRMTAGGEPSILGTLAMGSDATLDLRDNDLIVVGGNESAIRGLVGNWWNQGLKNGLGLLSSTASLAASNGLTTLAVTTNIKPDGSPIFATTYAGIDVLSTDVIVKYTYLGDTNLDGLVDSTDLANLIGGIRNSRTGWFNGDTNYDGVVDGLDYANLVQSLNLQGAVLSTPVVDGGGVGTGAGQIPEPAALGLLAGALPLMLRGGRRRRA